MRYLVCILLVTAQGALAQPKNGQPIPDFPIKTLLNAPTQTTTLAAQRGKLVLLEFWATWCAPCLEAMPHLSALQDRHAHQLQVITVTDETTQRISQYLSRRPSKLWVAIDSAQTIANLFPHHIIPHTVLIDTDGKLVAQTDPNVVTDALIDSLWRHQTVHIAEKTDNPMSVQEIVKTYFQAADTTKNRFLMQAELTGAPGVRIPHLQDSVFKNRRLTCLNLPMTTLYRIAYGDYSYKRTIDKTGSTDKSPLYCLDLIVEQPAQLLPTLQAELAKRFDIKASLESQSKEVYSLRIADPKKFSQLTRNPAGKRTYGARQGEINQKAVTMADLADFLENYALRKQIVVDHTQNREKIDIAFTYQPENPQSLTEVLSNMGLSLTKEQQLVEMLILQP